MGEIYATVHRHAAENPHKAAVVNEQGKVLSYQQLIEAVDARVQQFSSVVKTASSRVAFCLHEGERVPVIVLALNRLGVPIIPLNPTLQVSQLHHLIDAVDANVIIAEPATEYLFEKMGKSLQKIVVKPFAEVAPPAIELDQTAHGSYSHDEAFLITLSSGSTGDPKPIIFSEQNKLNRARQAEQSYQVTANDRILCASPFFHSLGQRLTLLPLLLGATLVQLTRFTANRWADLVERQQVSFTIPVSSHLHELVSLLTEESARFVSLRCLVSSSAAISGDVKQRLFDALECDFHEMYGASEVATATDLNRKQALAHPGSVGVPCPGVQLRIIDAQGEQLPDGEIGEILVSSPLASPGYYRLPEITECSFIEGYFHTGDLGYLDSEGYLYFVNRKKEIIVTGGMNIYPSDIESVLSEQVNVTTAVVVGIHDSYLGEVAVAIVVGEGDPRTLERALRGCVREKLSPYQHPLRYFFREQLPMTASGKVDKMALQDELNGLGMELSAKLRALQGDQ
ncbi:MAG: acyl--CoA ligase [Gammaproteobacteria bacterium]|jgi:acyl-CoA synthetase (AMP-forming)/AMP-acid ligase II|nr:acyl--CoA ligase [Gammaproteobacteria bacterium]MBT3717505.1 acyl--CoA ligase [Gammaproteobacteria bacterium]MBT3844658.1 acyl--CoA ligase [Gammaproteobacteria bacterium]MBT4299678.1 acyl--CoA ligase [Gammaproteobacteria bacterium]MBT4789810.1 acyl--CoA ligase [Gammaproteobacteria bacterium]